MKRLGGLAVAIVLLTFAPAAQAQTVDMYKVKCSDFVELEKESVMMVWAWLYGWYAADEEDPNIDFKDLATKGAKLFEFCKSNPGVDIIRAAEPIYEKK